MSERSTAFTKAFGLGLALIFALVGGVFVILPGEMLAFFNAMSRRLGMVEGPVEPSFFVVLAGGYMYVVAVLAWLMYRSPRERIYPLLLSHAKLASAALSFAMFVAAAPWLIYLVNGIVDGGLGLIVLTMYFRSRSGNAGEGGGA